MSIVRTVAPDGLRGHDVWRDQTNATSLDRSRRLPRGLGAHARRARRVCLEASCVWLADVPDVVPRGRRRGNQAESQLALWGLRALEQFTPVIRVDVDVEPLGRCFDPLPRLIAVGVGYSLHLVEPGNGVADVPRVV